MLAMASPVALPTAKGRSTIHGLMPVSSAPEAALSISEQLAEQSKGPAVARRGISERLDSGEPISATEAEAVQTFFGDALKIWTRCLIVQIDGSAGSIPQAQAIQAAETSCQAYRSEFVEWLVVTVRAMGEQPSRSDISQAMLQWDEKQRAGMIGRLNRRR